MLEDNDIMKEGKSINQFPRRTSLTGDELFLVNQKQDNGTYVSRYMHLSALRDYINTNTIYDQPDPIIPAPDGDEFEFNVPGDTQIRTLSAGTWECTIVGGGGGMYSKSITTSQTNGKFTTYSTTINRYVGHSSPMIKGTFTLTQNTTCKFHVGELPIIGSYVKQNTTVISGEPLPTDTDEDSYVYEGYPSYILIGDAEDELNESNSIAAVKAQKWYPSVEEKNTPYGWNYWDGLLNPYINRLTPDEGSCEDGTGGSRGYVSQYQGAINVGPCRTKGTDYGRTPHMTYEKYLWWDEVCQINQIGYRFYTGTGTGGYIHVKKLS